MIIRIRRRVCICVSFSYEYRLRMTAVRAQCIKLMLVYFLLVVLLSIYSGYRYFSYRIYFNCELLRFCHVEVKYYSIEFEQTYIDLLSWIWVYFPICLGLIYMVFRLISHHEIQALNLHGESKSWQVGNYLLSIL